MNAAEVIERAKARGVLITTAESCTGGLIAAALTDIAGSSAAFDRGFVTYSNAAKTDMLGVPPELIEAHGAVSREAAAAMATGALERSQATLSVAVTGIAGPGGGTATKPVGLVYIASTIVGMPVIVEEHRFAENDSEVVSRAQVREETVRMALRLLASQLDGVPGP